MSGLEWVVSSYLLTVTELLLVGGRLAYLFERRRLYLVGIVVFALASLAAGLAGSGGVLIGSRAIQGIGAALLMPTTLNQQCLDQQGLSPLRPWPSSPPSTSARPS